MGMIDISFLSLMLILRRVWVYILKRKDDAFARFKEWKTLIERQTRKKVKRIRTDNGLEYFLEQFNKFCVEEGIVRHKTIRGTP